MADTGWLPATNSYQPGSSWANLGNIYAADGATATQSTTGTAETTYAFANGFSGLSIPAGATIDGIEVRVRCAITSGTYSYSYSFIHLNSDFYDWNVRSTSSLSIAASLNGTLTDKTFGGPTSLFGGVDTNSNNVMDRPFASTDFNEYTAVGFAFAGTGSSTFAIDRVELKVYYTLAATAGPSAGGTFATSGPGTRAWVNPSNAGADDNSHTTCTCTGSQSITGSNFDYLDITNFGFSIPDSTTVIKGVTVKVRRFRNGGSTGEIRDNTIQLLKAGTRSGTNKAATGTNWPTSETEVTLGSATDLWGNALTFSDINNSGFGVSIRIVGSTNGTNRVANIDYVSIQVDYTYVPGGGGGPQNGTAIFWAFP